MAVPNAASMTSRRVINDIFDPSDILSFILIKEKIGSVKDQPAFAPEAISRAIALERGRVRYDGPRAPLREDSKVAG